MKRFIFAIIVFVSLQSFAQFRAVYTRSGAVPATSFGQTCANFSTSGTSTSCTLTGVLAGSTIFANCIGGGGGNCTVSDGTAYTMTSPSGLTDTGGGSMVVQVYRANVSAGNYTLTATTSVGTGGERLWAIEVKNASTFPIGSTNCVASPGSSSTTINTPTITSVDGGATVIATALATQTVQASPSGSYTNMTVQDGNGSEYQTNVSAGSYSPLFTQSPAGGWTSCASEISPNVLIPDDGNMLLSLGTTTSGSVSAANLTTDTKCGNGVWGNSATGMTYSNSVSPAAPAFLRSMFSCGLSYAGSAAVTTVSDNVAGTGSFSYTPNFISSTGSKLSAGFWYMTDATNAAGSSISTTANFNIQSTNVGFSALSLSRDTSGNLFVDLETSNAGTATHTSTLAISRLTWYWISIQHTPGAASSMKVYDVSGTLLTTLTAGVNEPSGTSTNLNVGPRAGSGATNAANAYIHGILVNYTTGNHIAPQ